MLRRALNALICLALVLAASATAHAVDPVGDEFQANQFTLCNQRDPSTVGLVNGNFVVVWESGSADDTQDGSYQGVFARLYDDEGNALGDEFQINEYTTSSQTNADVAAASSGGFVVTWQSYLQDGEAYSMMARVYDADGEAESGEFRVNSETLGSQGRGRIAPVGSGFVVVWESIGQDGDESGVFAQRLNSAGAAVGPEFAVNTVTLGDQFFPVVAGNASGAFTVAWTSGDTDLAPFGQDGSGDGVFMRSFDPSGNPTTGEIQVNVFTTGNQRRPELVMNDDGSGLMVWESAGLIGETFTDDSVIARAFDSSGSPTGDEYRINTYTTGSQDDVAIAQVPGGDILVVWETPTGFDAVDDSGTMIFARRLLSDGTPTEDRFQVNTYTTEDQTDARVAALANGGFAIVWEGDGQDGTLDGVFGQVCGPARACGDGNGDGTVSATDALLTLNAAVGVATCDLCVCDVDSSGAITASDALKILQFAVGSPVELVCVPC